MKRKTVSIPDDLMKELIRVSGRRGYSDAIVSSLKEYVSLRHRLEYLNELFSKKAPHSFSKIKAGRKLRKWS